MLHPSDRNKEEFSPLIDFFSSRDFKISFFTHFPISLFPLPERWSDHDSVSSGHAYPHIVPPFVAPCSDTTFFLTLHLLLLVGDLLDLPPAEGDLDAPNLGLLEHPDGLSVR